MSEDKPIEQHDDRAHTQGQEHAVPHHEHERHAAAVPHSHERRDLLDSMRGKVRTKHVVSTVAYLLMAMLIFSPIVANMANVAPGIGGDTYQNLWGLWWVSYATFHLHTSIWFTYLIFWPVGANLAYQTMSPIGSIITAPFQAVSVPFAYNVLFLMGFMLSGLTMFILADYITKNSYAAFFAGLVFSFSSFHIAQGLGHIDWMNIEWIPLALYFFIRIVKDQRKYLYAVGLGLSFVLAAFMGDVEQAIMLVLLLVVTFVGYIIVRSTRRMMMRPKFWYAVGLSLAVAFIAGSFGFVPLIRTVTSPGGLSSANILNNPQNEALWSDPILSFLLPSYYNGIFHKAALGYSNIYSTDATERTAYIGYTVILLALFGIYRSFREARLWIAIALIFGWMALGPVIQVGSYAAQGIPGIYALYSHIPGFNVAQEPDRFYAVFSVGTAVLAALGMSSLLGLLGKRRLFGGGTYMSIAVVGIVSLLFLAESAGFMTGALAQVTTTHISVPAFYTILGNLSANFSVLQLPAISNPNVQFPALAAGQATYYTTASHKPLVGGYGGRENLTQELTLADVPLAIAAANLQTGNLTYQSPVVGNYTAETLLALYNYKTAFVVVNEPAYNTSEAQQLELYLLSVFGNPVYVDNTTVAFATSNAINASIFREYAAYPLATEWQARSAFINGSVVTMWQPLGDGAISVFAPYRNTTGIQQKIYAQRLYTVNTTVSFYAVATGGPASLSIDTPTSQTAVRQLGAFNLTGSIRHYILNVSVASGPQGNAMLFIVHGQGTVGISNITFSEIR